MDFNGVQKGLKNLGGVILKNSPVILTGLGCAGVLGTAILTGRATLKASEIIKMEEEKRNNDSIPNKEIIRLTWKVFVPPIIMGTTSIACIVGANSINASRNAALAALYSLSETALREYKDKVVEEIGRSRELKVRDSIAQDRVVNNPVDDKTIIITGNGDVLCYDTLSDRYFKSSAEKIRQQVLELNESLRTEMWLSLNDFYYAIGLPSTKLGDLMGFDMDKGYIQINYSSQLTPDNKEPCLVIDTEVYPRYNY